MLLTVERVVVEIVPAVKAVVTTRALAVPENVKAVRVLVIVSV